MKWILVAALFLCGAALFGVVGTLAGRRFIHRHVAENHNDVLAPVFLTAGTIYAVLLGFLVIATWESYDTARANTAEEASLLVPLYRQTMAMAPEPGGQMRALIRAYAADVADGWPRFRASGEGSVKARQTIDAMLKVFGSLTPATKVREISAAQFLQTFSQLLLDRDKRLQQARDSLSWVMWLAVVGGGVITLGMSFVLFMDSPVPHATITSLLAALIVLLLLVLAVLSHPFTGPVAVGPEPFAASLKLFDAIDSDFR